MKINNKDITSSEALMESLEVKPHKKGENWDEEVMPELHPFHDLYDLEGNRIHDGHANFMNAINKK